MYFVHETCNLKLYYLKVIFHNNIDREADDDAAAED